MAKQIKSLPQMVLCGKQIGVSRFCSSRLGTFIEFHPYPFHNDVLYELLDCVGSGNVISGESSIEMANGVLESLRVEQLMYSVTSEKGVTVAAILTGIMSRGWKESPLKTFDTGKVISLLDGSLEISEDDKKWFKNQNCRWIKSYFNKRRVTGEISFLNQKALDLTKQYFFKFGHNRPNGRFAISVGPLTVSHEDSENIGGTLYEYRYKWFRGY